MNEYTRELMHHGVLGMEWGKRMGPPYPLKPSMHSSKERKAGWQDSLEPGSPSYVKKTKNAITAGIAKAKATAKSTGNKLKDKASKTYSNAKKEVGEKASKAKSAISEKWENRKRLSPETKKKIAIAIAATAAVTVTAVALANTDAGRKAVRNAYKVMDKLNTIDTGYSEDVHKALRDAATANDRKWSEMNNLRSEVFEKARAKAMESASKTSRIIEKDLATAKEIEEANLNAGLTWTKEFEFVQDDWVDHMAKNDQKALDAIDKILEKYEANQIGTSTALARYSEQHFSKYNTKRTQKAMLQYKTQLNNLKKSWSKISDKLVNKFGSEADRADRQIRAAREAGKQIAQQRMNTWLSEMQNTDISADLEFIRQYLEAA